MKTIVFIIFLSATLVCNGLQVKGQQERDNMPNIVWIVAEDMSPHLGCYGEKIAKTPNLDKFAKEAIRFTRAFATAGVCAPSRSAIITGMYQTSIGTQHMRSLIRPADAKYSPVPRYSAVLPNQVKCFTEYLRSNGYYCTNNEKQDYQFEPPVTAWDENSKAASWRNRPSGKPFFSVFNFFKSHESQLFPSNDPLRVEASSVIVPPFYPETPTVRQDIARFLTNVEIVDRQVGELIALLKKDNVYDNTIIFFFGDHGDALPWMKRELYDRGIRIPLIVLLPDNIGADTVNDDLVSTVDFAPTVLSLAGISIPEHMEGQAFLGSQKSKPRDYIYAARDRMDTEYDRVRIVRDKQFKYVFNYMPEKINYQEIAFRLGIPMMNEILQLRNERKLNDIQMRWFNTKPSEELYDLESDPNELYNLVNVATYKSKLNELRNAFNAWTIQTKDRGGIPEKEMIQDWWNGKNEPPNVSEIRVEKVKNGVTLRCETPGASIAYRILNQELQGAQHEIMTWDFGLLDPKIRNGGKLPAAPVWNLYQGTIHLERGDTLVAQAYRAGYKESSLQFICD